MRWTIEVSHESGQFQTGHFVVVADTESEAYDKARAELRPGWEVDDLWPEDQDPRLNT